MFSQQQVKIAFVEWKANIWIPEELLLLNQLSNSGER